MNDAQGGQGPTFISLEDAAAMTTGTRITFIPGLPALYAEALKNLCYVKQIPIIRALHPMMGIDKATGEDRQARLYALTSQTSLPTMFHDQERPRNVWIEQLALAERIGGAASPPLVPTDYGQQVEMYGLCAVILGEDGFVWNLRILNDGPLGRKYGYSDAASAAAPGKVADVLRLLGQRLAQQAERGSPYLVGDALSAADIYWATMVMGVLPMPPELMPRTRENQAMLQFFEANGKRPEIAEALSDRITEHQHYILNTYCETPAVLGGTPL